MKCAEYVEWILGYEVVWIFLDLANPTLFGNFEFVFEFSLVGWVERINRIASITTRRSEHYLRSQYAVHSETQPTISQPPVGAISESRRVTSANHPPQSPLGKGGSTDRIGRAIVFSSNLQELYPPYQGEAAPTNSPPY